MLVQDALTIVAGEVCLQVHSVIASATQAVRVVPGKIADGAHASWLAQEAKLFTLARHDGQTLVYSHDTETLYYARPELALTGECPDGHAFLVQVLEDRAADTADKKGWELPGIPRVLVMDLVAPAEACPRRRRERLWAMRGAFPPLCSVQWAGERSALEAFLARGLPHDVQAVVAFTEPLRVTKELRLQIPAPSFAGESGKKRARDENQ